MSPRQDKRGQFVEPHIHPVETGGDLPPAIDFQSLLALACVRILAASWRMPAMCSYSLCTISLASVIARLLLAL
jgi:hypothetical protein